MTISQSAYATLETALNRYLRLDPQALEKLDEMHGRIIGIEIPGFESRLFLAPSPNGIQVLGEIDGEPDCVIRGSPLALARMRTTAESADQLFSGSVEISGNTELGQRFGAFIAGLDIDWEEQLSRFTGDIIAHEIGSGLRAASDWAKKAADTTEDNLREYLQEELRLLPTAFEIEGFLSAVDSLRDDVERLAARIEILRRQRTAESRHTS